MNYKKYYFISTTTLLLAIYRNCWLFTRKNIFNSKVYCSILQNLPKFYLPFRSLAIWAHQVKINFLRFSCARMTAGVVMVEFLVTSFATYLMLCSKYCAKSSSLLRIFFPSSARSLISASLKTEQ